MGTSFSSCDYRRGAPSGASSNQAADGDRADAGARPAPGSFARRTTRIDPDEIPEFEFPAVELEPADLYREAAP
jgi:hypothetical protein